MLIASSTNPMDPGPAYILEPFVSTLAAGGRALFSDQAFVTQHFAMLPQYVGNATRLASEISALNLRRPDVVVCVNAAAACEQFPWRLLRQLGVLTVLYQTEPLHDCP